MSSSIQQIAARIVRLERQVNDHTPQLKFSSIEDSGSIDSNHWDGRTMAQYGGQFDGTFGAMALIGPTPPTPSMPVATPIAGGLTVRWDGLFTNALNAPLDFSRIEVHASAVSDFVADLATTLRTTIETPRGCDAVIRLPAGLYYVKLVTRSLSGGASPSSVQSSGTSLDAASVVDLFDTLALAETYTDMRLIDAEAYTDTATAPRSFTTGSRPAAATAGVGAMIFDSTLGKPVWSDGTDWKDATGTTV